MLPAMGTMSLSEKLSEQSQLWGRWYAMPTSINQPCCKHDCVRVYMEAVRELKACFREALNWSRLDFDLVSVRASSVDSFSDLAGTSAYLSFGYQS